MIDLREARNNPDAFRTALARRGAADAFDALLVADERWRALVPQVDELRARQKLDGKPTPEQLDKLVGEGFKPMIPPVLVREEAMYGTGFFPSDKSDYYAVPEDGLYLVGTSEVPLIGMHLDEILDELPIRYCAFSSCFRREAGAAGRDTRGMFRVHQFQKVEMVVYTHPEQSWDVHEQMLAIEEALVQAVELPYRVVNSAVGDLSTAAAKRYDIEAWFPSQERYREITSCSNTTDFQARRSGIRYRTEDGRLETPHTLNGTAATDRWVLAILENFQGDVPDVLQQYGAPAQVTK